MSRKTFSAWVGAAALALASVACDNTAEGVKRDADENARAASEATADARERADRASERAADRADQAADRAADSADRAGDRASEATRNAGDRAGEATKDVGRAADAAVQTVDVKSALIADKRIDASNINVDTDAATKTVTLKGHVPTAAQKTVAGEIASAKAEGYRIKNELRVG